MATSCTHFSNKCAGKMIKTSKKWDKLVTLNQLEIIQWRYQLIKCKYFRNKTLKHKIKSKVIYSNKDCNKLREVTWMGISGKSISKSNNKAIINLTKLDKKNWCRVQHKFDESIFRWFQYCCFKISKKYKFYKRSKFEPSL